MLFNVDFRQINRQMDVSFDASEERVSVDFGVIQTAAVNYERYAGEYDVTPKVEAQSLATKNKFLTDDVRIHEIPYFDVGNTSGGSTVYIGTLEELIGTTAILGTAKLGVMTL